MDKCKRCGVGLLTDTVEILGEMVKREYCDPCIAKAKQAYDNLTESQRPKVNPPKKAK